MDTPLLLNADNFTPPARTPWGGTRIRSVYKVGLVQEGAVEREPVGESWELSVEPDFPSRVQGSGELLSEAIARDPARLVGPEAARRAGGCPLLVKLLDAADDLSLQIHPRDDYPGLGPGESGKPESWYVLHAEPEGGLYLGFRRGVTRARLERSLERGGDVGDRLFFVPVRTGDFFVIEAGTPHAIGRGVTLVEPQRVWPGKRGVTYRYWDWNRRYDGDGNPDPNGGPRALHLEHALAVTTWDGPREQDLLERIRHRAGPPDREGEARLEPLGGASGPVPSSALEVQRLVGTGVLTVPSAPRLRGLTVVQGTVRLTGTGFDVEVTRGRSAVLPAALPQAQAELRSAHAILSSAVA